jgi:hypothetical protein
MKRSRLGKIEDWLVRHCLIPVAVAALAVIVYLGSRP